MTPVPLIPDNAPFSPEQRSWLNGFLAGVFSRSASSQPSAQPQPTALAPLTILFGSQTGTAENLAKKRRQRSRQARLRAHDPRHGADRPRQARGGAERARHHQHRAATANHPDNAKALHTALRGASPQRQPSVSALKLLRLCARRHELRPVLPVWQGPRRLVRKTRRRPRDPAYRLRPRLRRALSRSGWTSRSRHWLRRPVLEPGRDRDAGLPDSANEPAPTDEETGLLQKEPLPRVPSSPSATSTATGSAKEVNHVEFSLEGSGLDLRSRRRVSV